MKVKVKRLCPEAIMPTYATDGAACFDLRAVGIPGGSITIENGTAYTFRTGLAFEVPQGWCLEIHSRSGHGFKHGIRLSNCCGILDADFRGEALCRLRADNLEGPFLIKNGDRIAQAMLVETPKVTFEEVDELSDTTRGAGGFGSTGS